MKRRRGAAHLAMLASLCLSGCVYANAGVETFSIRSEPGGNPVVETRSASLGLSPTEIAYARDTSRIVFRRGDGERTERFVRTSSEGHALCLRAGGDYALLTFQRRIYDSAISQAADDAIVSRSPADTAVCRAVDDWTKM